jgi:hypothetical protein
VRGGGVWGKFKTFLVMGQSKLPNANKTLKIFLFCGVPQLIQLINTNHNEHPSSCKNIGQNW